MKHSQTFRNGIGILLILAIMSCTPQTEYLSFEDYPVYKGDDLGLTYSQQSSSFRLWSPTAEEVVLRLYNSGHEGEAIESFNMQRDVNGTWLVDIQGDHRGKFYAYQVKSGGNWLAETPGPYAKAVGVNGIRAYITDLKDTDPQGWEDDQRPALNSFNDVIIYEIHIRDMSMDPNSGITNKGKFIGLTETGTTSAEGMKTGIDHIEELGVTHVHVLPMFDYKSIDETTLEKNEFNWGYEPQNYNAPEGSYATDPYDPETRIRELKSMVKAFHDKGIRVIMDVVYNHTGFGDPSTFNLSLAVPDYYYRFNDDGSPSDASACGNETASEREMMRKYIVESVKYWVDEYHIDGFRFDLMGIHDIQTMNAVKAELAKIDPSLFVYGEGWKAGDSPLPDDELALKKNVTQLRGVAAFSDEIRDGIKGAWNDWEEPGFVGGNSSRIDGVKFGITAGTPHPQVDYANVNESDAPWSPSPDQCIVYVTCHDNHTLYDKLKIASPEASEEDILRMHILANTIVLTSQGVPFLHAGVDFVRTKKGEENSYKSPDSINQLDWSMKSTHQDVFQFYQDLIALRKNHPAFRLQTSESIAKNIQFIDAPAGSNFIGYSLNGAAANDSWTSIMVLFNGNENDLDIDLPEGDWTVALKGKDIDESGLESVSTSVTVPSYSAVIAFQ